MSASSRTLAVLVVLNTVAASGCRPAPAASPPPASPSPTSAPSLVPPRRIKYVEPVRPKGPRPAGEGVVIELLIDKTGKVERVELQKSLAPAWDEAALFAARQWEYTPTIWKGEPAVMYLTVTVRFDP